MTMRQQLRGGLDAPPSLVRALLIIQTSCPGQAQEGASAVFLLPACRLYLQSEVRGSRLLLERGVCLGTIETVLRLHRNLSVSESFLPPPQVTLETATRVVVDFARSRQQLQRPLMDCNARTFIAACSGLTTDHGLTADAAPASSPMLRFQASAPAPMPLRTVQPSAPLWSCSRAECPRRAWCLH
jgi:hypothetical protein